MFRCTRWALIFATAAVHVHAASQNFFPAGIPLSVRSPYMNVWHNSTNTSDPLSSAYPIFWSSAALGWSGKIRVNGTLYSWLGAGQTAPNVATVTNVSITPTRSVYTMRAGPMGLTITFLSPIELTDWVKQSLPFSYVSVELNSLDGAAHFIQLYSDINAEWVSGTGGSIVKWTTLDTANSIYHAISLQTPVPNVELRHQAEDGTAYYALPPTPNLSWQIDRGNITSQQFMEHGELTNTSSTVFGPILPDVPVFAFSIDLGTIKSTASAVTWSLGYVRDPSVQYTTPSGAIELRRPYYVMQYPNISAAIDAVVEDAPAAHDRAVALDTKITADAEKISSQYVDLISLATRQTLGSLDITVVSDAQGGVNGSDVKIFMKNMGIDQRVNPVERMYAAWPAFLYLNASLCAPMLVPLLESQDARVGQLYASPDLGTLYPIATGGVGLPSEGVEESGNMLIMMLSYAQVTGDGSLLSQHYDLLKRWADYLVPNTLAPKNQISADNEGNDNIANLALKGIIGVKAMAEISRALGNDTDAQTYDDHAASLMESWQSLALSADKTHILSLYGDPQTSWSLSYNLYADKLLGTNIVPSPVLANHTKFLSSLFATAPPFGLPIDTRTSQTSSVAWLLFTAAAVVDQEVRDTLVQFAWSKANFNGAPGVFSNYYNDVSGKGSDFASPGVGGIFSLLASTLSNTTISATGPSNKGQAGNNGGGNTNSGNKVAKSHVGAIAGGVVGGVAVAAGAIFVAFYLRKSRRNRRRRVARSMEKRPIEVIEIARRSKLPLHGRASHDSGASPSELPSLYRTFTPTEVSMAQVDGEGVTPHGAGLVAGAEDLAFAAASVQVHVSGTASGVQSPVPRSEVFPRSTGSESASLSPTEVGGLREEVQGLRGAMRQLHAERFEQPPAYSA